MIRYGVTTLRVLDLLEHIGPMTRSELADRLGIERDRLSGVLTRLLRPALKPPAPRRIHVCAWVDDHAGQRRYLRPVYGLGDAEDKRRPRGRHLQIRREIWRRKETLARAASVFAWGGV